MTDNILTSSLGEVEFSSNVRWYGTYVSYPQVYNCLLINNPNMIFLRHNHNDYPILGVDAYAHLVVRYLIGEIPIPTSEEMTSANQKQALYEMQFPYARYYMDSNYRHAWDNTTLVIPVSAVDSDCIDHDNDTAEIGEERALKSSEIWEALKGEYEKYDFRIIAHIMQQANYPLSIGTYEALNETGETLYDYGYQTYYDRAHVNPDDSSWRTFRDTQKAHKYRSLYTGTPAVCLPKRWIDINESKEDVLELIRLRQQQQQQDKNDETTTTTKFVGQQQQPIATTSQ
eukprot:CAMPEP_0202455926 /NCGR_PEP_ID=MMETSP1360-20130828/13329_1 /ASSEMBLY_ACC=CAM_ASM_000848 /TAXON_ID=515479 /ORGANISM="Licmophora paradoxa, Strain CCMP2313" /LENGTH=285 /DNA_ID=CAMNT_0049075619 /DNA_START=1 /DNA_END=858 /DNA_ORIENTATION=-